MFRAPRQRFAPTEEHERLIRVLDVPQRSGGAFRATLSIQFSCHDPALFRLALVQRSERFVKTFQTEVLTASAVSLGQTAEDVYQHLATSIGYSAGLSDKDYEDDFVYLQGALTRDIPFRRLGPAEVLELQFSSRCLIENLQEEMGLLKAQLPAELYGMRVRHRFSPRLKIAVYGSSSTGKSSIFNILPTPSFDDEPLLACPVSASDFTACVWRVIHSTGQSRVLLFPEDEEEGPVIIPIDFSGFDYVDTLSRVAVSFRSEENENSVPVVPVQTTVTTGSDTGPLLHAIDQDFEDDDSVDSSEEGEEEEGEDEGLDQLDEILNARTYRPEVVVEVNSPLLSCLELVDLPGLGETVELDDMVLEEVQSCDLLLFVPRPNRQGIRQDDSNLLKELLSQAARYDRETKVMEEGDWFYDSDEEEEEEEEGEDEESSGSKKKRNAFLKSLVGAAKTFGTLLVSEESHIPSEAERSLRDEMTERIRRRIKRRDRRMKRRRKRRLPTPESDDSETSDFDDHGDDDEEEDVELIPLIQRLVVVMNKADLYLHDHEQESLDPRRPKRRFSARKRRRVHRDARKNMFRDVVGIEAATVGTKIFPKGRVLLCCGHQEKIRALPYYRNMANEFRQTLLAIASDQSFRLPAVLMIQEFYTYVAAAFMRIHDEQAEVYDRLVKVEALRRLLTRLTGIREHLQVKKTSLHGRITRVLREKSFRQNLIKKAKDTLSIEKGTSEEDATKLVTAFLQDEIAKRAGVCYQNEIVQMREYLETLLGDLKSILGPSAGGGSRFRLGARPLEASVGEVFLGGLGAVGAGAIVGGTGGAVVGLGAAVAAEGGILAGMGFWSSHWGVCCRYSARCLGWDSFPRLWT